MLRRTVLSLCLVSLVAPLCSAAVPALSNQAALDAGVAKHLGAGFNGVVLVRNGLNGESIVGAYGQANFEQPRALTADSLFQIGSISKWVTAVAVLRLVDQGKLALDTPVGAYFPELPEQVRAKVTLRHLLSNTAGISNGMGQAYKQDKSVAALPLSHAHAALRFVSAPVLFAPGSGWDYSPTTSIVVAAIIERVTGKPYSAVVDQLVLGPAKARAMAVPRTPFKDLPAAALAYKSTTPRELATSPHVVFVEASGTIYGTAADLAQLAHAVYETPLLSAASRQELQRIVVSKQEYALGGRVKQLDLGGRLRKVAWETGATGGAKSVLAYVPGEGKTVVVLNNTDMAQSDMAEGAIALLRGLYE